MRYNIAHRAVTRTFVVFALGLMVVASLGTARAGITERVSVASDGTQGNAPSRFPSISADGRYVAFASSATNLVPGDTNARGDVFVRDRQTSQTTRVSIASDGSQGKRSSSSPFISPDGRFVAFSSAAGNLVAGDTNGYWDVFVHDRQTAQTTRVSVASGGGQGNDDSDCPSINADGRFVAFWSGAENLVPGDTNLKADVFVHDRQTGQTTRVSVASDGAQGNSVSHGGPISADGCFVAFDSWATNLVAGDTNEYSDVFVRDRHTGQTTRVSMASDGTQANRYSLYPSISADGRYVGFVSGATNLVPGYTDPTTDVFVRDRQTGQTTLVSVASDGTQGNNPSEPPAISADGRFVAFFSWATNLVPADTNGVHDVFVHDRGGPSLPADVNGDCVVNILDLLAVRNRLGQDPTSGDNWRADVNGDGAINILDLIFVRNELGTACE